MNVNIIRNNITNQMIVLKNKNLCKSFCDALLKECSLEHYTSWLDVHSKKDNSRSWKEYRNKVQPTTEEFIVIVCKIKFSDRKSFKFADRIVRNLLKEDKEVK